MVMLADVPALNPEFEKLKEEVRKARAEYAQRLEDYTVLTGITRPELENEYMLKIGRKEHRLFSCRLEIMRLRREISLYQAAANRRESISPETVQQILKQEFREYQEMLQELKDKVHEAETSIPGQRMSASDALRRKKLYHKIAHKLHPDLNPDLPAGAAALWQRVQSAYSSGDLQELEVLNDLVDEMLEGKEDFIRNINSMELMREELEKMQEKIRQLEEKLSKITGMPPFTYAEMLNDAEALRAKRQELEDEIQASGAHIEELRKIKEQFGV